MVSSRLDGFLIPTMLERTREIVFLKYPFAWKNIGGRKACMTRIIGSWWDWKKILAALDCCWIAVGVPSGVLRCSIILLCFSLSKTDAKKVRVESVVTMFFLGTLESQCVANSQNQKRTPTWIGVDECPQSRWKQCKSKFPSCNVVGLNKAQETKFTPRDWGILDFQKQSEWYTCYFKTRQCVLFSNRPTLFVARLHLPCKHSLTERHSP